MGKKIPSSSRQGGSPGNLSITSLKTWENKQLVAEAIGEIIDVHHRYRIFAALTQDEAIDYINKNFLARLLTIILY